jgi:hypothetical protein
MHQFGCKLQVSITLPFRIAVFEDEFWPSMYPSSRSASRSFSKLWCAVAHRVSVSSAWFKDPGEVRRSKEMSLLDKPSDKNLAAFLIMLT